MQAAPYELTDVAASQSAIETDIVNNQLHVQSTRTGTQTFGDWQASHFTPGEVLDPAVAGLAANPYAHGLANGFDYLGETDPRNPPESWTPSTAIEDLTPRGLPGEWLTFRFRASSLIDDLRLLPQYSSELVNWSAEEPVFLDQLLLTQSLREYVFRSPPRSAPPSRATSGACRSKRTASRPQGRQYDFR